ncbi:hypothetical protein FKW77_010734 [Venturia effusa]|uniref:Uncharacterized protein n=1 Tax=Venturia effusa TaxID=50376 RepID=A0A517KYA1_9PEZI|nr:hypothetical protein FKW77_010734 [Venturia effusa]
MLLGLLDGPVSILLVEGHSEVKQEENETTAADNGKEPYAVSKLNEEAAEMAGEEKDRDGLSKAQSRKHTMRTDDPV